LKRWIWLPLLILIGAAALYLSFVFTWSYSTGERAGWVQKVSRKGWLCKTWEGEMAMVTMPGAIPDKFYFTVRDEGVVKQINQTLGRRVALDYEQKKGLPSSCFGETEYWITGLRLVPDLQAPGVLPPASPASPAVVPPAPASPGAPGVVPPASVSPVPPGVVPPQPASPAQ
jgi:hypothetical protein